MERQQANCENSPAFLAITTPLKSEGVNSLKRKKTMENGKPQTEAFNQEMLLRGVFLQDENNSEQHYIREVSAYNQQEALSGSQIQIGHRENSQPSTNQSKTHLYKIRQSNSKNEINSSQANNETDQMWTKKIDSSFDQQVNQPAHFRNFYQNGISSQTPDQAVARRLGIGKPSVPIPQVVLDPPSMTRKPHTLKTLKTLKNPTNFQYKKSSGFNNRVQQLKMNQDFYNRQIHANDNHLQYSHGEIVEGFQTEDGRGQVTEMTGETRTNYESRLLRDVSSLNIHNNLNLPAGTIKSDLFDSDTHRSNSVAQLHRLRQQPHGRSFKYGVLSQKHLKSQMHSNKSPTRYQSSSKMLRQQQKLLTNNVTSNTNPYQFTHQKSSNNCQSHEQLLNKKVGNFEGSQPRNMTAERGGELDRFNHQNQTKTPNLQGNQTETRTNESSYQLQQQLHQQGQNQNNAYEQNLIAQRPYSQLPLMNQNCNEGQQQKSNSSQLMQKEFKDVGMNQNRNKMKRILRTQEAGKPQKYKLLKQASHNITPVKQDLNQQQIQGQNQNSNDPRQNAEQNNLNHYGRNVQHRDLQSHVEIASSKSRDLSPLNKSHENQRVIKDRQGGLKKGLKSQYVIQEGRMVNQLNRKDKVVGGHIMDITTNDHQKVLQREQNGNGGTSQSTFMRNIQYMQKTEQQKQMMSSDDNSQVGVHHYKTFQRKTTKNSTPSHQKRINKKLQNDNKSAQKSSPRRLLNIQTDINNSNNLDESRLRLAFNNYQTNSTDLYELPQDLTERDQVDYLEFVRQLDQIRRSPALNDHEEAKRARLKNLKSQLDLKNQLSVFTIAENQGHINQSVFESSPHKELQPLQKATVKSRESSPELFPMPQSGSNKAYKEMAESRQHFKDFDILNVLEKNNKELKTLEFQVNNIVSQGLIHETVERSSFDKQHIFDLEIVENTYQLIKVPLLGLDSPMKLLIRYSNLNVQDLTVTYSKSNPKPDISNCIKQVENPRVISVDAQDGKRFSRDFLYLKLESKLGCKAHLKAVFPKQDIRENRLRKLAAAGEQEVVPAGQKQNKRKQDIDYQVKRFLTEPKLYDDFVSEHNEIKAIVMKRNLQNCRPLGSDGLYHEPEDWVRRNIEETRLRADSEGKKLQALEQSQKKQVQQEVAKQRRMYFIDELYKRKVFSTVKWYLIRAKRDQMQVHLDELKVNAKRKARILGMVQLQQILEKAASDFSIVRQRRILAARQKQSSLFMKLILKACMYKKGKNMDVRLERTARRAIQSLTPVMHISAEMRAKTILKQNIQKLATRFEMLCCFRTYAYRVTLVQNAYWKQIERNRVKQALVVQFFEEFLKDQRRKAQNFDIPKKKLSKKDTLAGKRTSQKAADIPVAKFVLLQQITREMLFQKAQAYFQLRKFDQRLQVMYRYDQNRQNFLELGIYDQIFLPGNNKDTALSSKPETSRRDKKSGQNTRTTVTSANGDEESDDDIQKIKDMCAGKVYDAMKEVGMPTLHLKKILKGKKPGAEFTNGVIDQIPLPILPDSNKSVENVPQENSKNQSKEKESSQERKQTSKKEVPNKINEKGPSTSSPSKKQHSQSAAENKKKDKVAAGSRTESQTNLPKAKQIVTYFTPYGLARQSAFHELSYFLFAVPSTLELQCIFTKIASEIEATNKLRRMYALKNKQKQKKKDGQNNQAEELSKEGGSIVADDSSLVTTIHTNELLQPSIEVKTEGKS